jgi:hypothetical protein
LSASARFQLRSSPALAAALVGGHVAAALGIFIALPGAAGGALAVALVALGGAAAWSRALLAAHSSVRAIEIGGAQATFELASGARFAAPVAARRYVTRHVVALPLGAPLRRTLLVTTDMLGAAEFRRLRIWALWNRLPAAAAGVAAKQLAA